MGGKIRRLMADCGVLILPANFRGTEHRAFINTPNHSYEVKVTVPPTKQLAHAKLEGDWRLANLIRGHEEIVQQYLIESQTVSELLGNIRDMLIQLESSAPSFHTLSLPLLVCRWLARDINSLGWSRVCAVDTLFRHIKLGIKDRKGREHILTISPTSKYPEEAPVVTVDGPVDFNPHWDKTSDLRSLVSQFSSWLDSLESFWSSMEELDTHTCILEPEHPTIADNRRRILMGTHLSLVLCVDPCRPLALPEPLQFLGPDDKVDKLKETVRKNSAHWNEKNSLLKNLKALLESEFPQPSSQEAEEMTEECPICYEYRWNGVVPSIICPNTHCAKAFHTECFKEYVRSLPRTDGLQSKCLVGDCPFCSQVITLRTM